MSDSLPQNRRLVDTRIITLAQDLKDMLTVGCDDEGFKMLLYNPTTSLHELDQALTRFLRTMASEGK